MGEDARREGISCKTPLVDLGMDSMALAQYKGLLQKKVYIYINTRAYLSDILLKCYLYVL